MQAAAEEDHRLRQPRHRRGGQDGRPDRHLPRRPARSSTTRRTTSWRSRPTPSSPISSARDRTLKRLRLITVADAMMPDAAVRARRGHARDAVEADGRSTATSSIVMVGPRGRPRGVVRLDAARRRKQGSLSREHARAAARRWSTCNDDLRTAVSVDVHARRRPGSPASTTTAFYAGYVTQQRHHRTARRERTRQRWTPVRSSAPGVSRPRRRRSALFGACDAARASVLRPRSRKYRSDIVYLSQPAHDDGRDLRRRSPSSSACRSASALTPPRSRRHVANT